MDKNIEKAVQLANDILSQPEGSNLMYIASIYYSLSVDLDEELTDDELITLTDRICEASGASTIPLLTAERVDAVRFMLEYGISPNRSPEFTKIDAAQAKKLLLTCDMEIFIDLVDAVAVDGHDYYSPDLDVLNKDLCEKINEAIDRVINSAPSLDDVVKMAEKVRAAVGEPSVSCPGQIFDVTNERYL